MTARPHLPEPAAPLATRAHRAKVRGWCPVCRYDIAPGEMVALPPGGSRYAHVICIAREAAAGD